MKKTTKLIFAYLLLSVIQGVFTAAFLLRTQSEINNSVLGGYSIRRLFFVAGIFALTCVFFVITVSFYRGGLWRDRVYVFFSQQNSARAILFLTFSVSLFLFLIPQYRFGNYQAYFLQLRPVVIWGLLFGLQTLFVFALLHSKYLLHFIRASKEKKTIVIGSILFLFLLIWLFIVKSGLGIVPDDRYWNVVGVPVLNEQILSALALSIPFLFIFAQNISDIKQEGFLKHLDLFLFFSLWIITAIIWLKTPLPDSFFTPGPYPPNNEIYPYADAAAFDQGGQFALLGQGFFNGVFYDRVLLSGFLALLHALVGQNYDLVTAFQTVLFSGFISILYLLGKNLYNRAVGILLALLGMFKGLNAIQLSTLILSSHPKFMLTEFPTAIMIVLFVFYLVRWLKSKDTDNGYLILCGSILGFGIMLRTNIFLLFFVVVAFIFVKQNISWLKKGQAFLLLTLAFFVVISPWMWRNKQVANQPFFFLPRFQNVLADRYSFEAQGHISNQGIYSRAIRSSARNNYLAQASVDITKTVYFVSNHFLHNIVTSVLILPTTSVYHDLKHTVKSAYPFWNKIDGQWTGDLTPLEGLGLFFNLAILSLGIGATWKKWRLAGLIPLATFLAYNLANALARTSGGRYIVPVDWVVLLYYAVGLIEIVSFVAPLLGYDANLEAEQSTVRQKPFSYKKGVLYLLPFFLFVAAITVVDQAVPPRYADLSKTDVADKLVQENFLEQTDISYQELMTFVETPDAEAFLGRDLYPRYYRIGKGEYTALETANSPREFPRLVFTSIGPFGERQAILPLSQSPSFFPHAADIIVIGCVRHPQQPAFGRMVDALLVVVIDGDQSAVYTRNPPAALACPLPDPVCDGNRNCK